MTFFWTADLGEFFFNGLEINTYAHLAILCAVVSLFAIFYEGIKVFKFNSIGTFNEDLFFIHSFRLQVFAAYSRARAAREQLAAVSCAPSESANLLITDSMRRKSFSQRLCRLLNETLVFFFHNSIGYAVMLSVMVYSGWLFLSVILGMSLGYFLFGHITMKVNMENINIHKTANVCPPTCPEAGTSGTSVLNLFSNHSFDLAHFNKVFVDFFFYIFSVSKAPSPCSTDSSDLYQSQTIAGASSNPCYENKISCETKTSYDCHTESEMSPKKTQTVNEEDCCCRL